MSDLRAIVYISAATAPFTDQQLEALLVVARELNLTSGVTGVLLYSLGNFMQYFEGEEEAVQVTYERILASKRHKNIVEIFDRPISTRSFASWQVGFTQPTQSELLALSTANWQDMSATPADATSTPAGLGLLRSFWQLAQQSSSPAVSEQGSV